VELVCQSFQHTFLIDWKSKKKVFWNSVPTGRWWGARDISVVVKFWRIFIAELNQYNTELKHKEVKCNIEQETQCKSITNITKKKMKLMKSWEIYSWRSELLHINERSERRFRKEAESHEGSGKAMQQQSYYNEGVGSGSAWHLAKAILNSTDHKGTMMIYHSYPYRQHEMQ